MKQPEIPLEALKLAKALILRYADKHKTDAIHLGALGEAGRVFHVQQAEHAIECMEEIEAFEIAYINSL